MAGNGNNIEIDAYLKSKLNPIDTVNSANEAADKSTALMCASANGHVDTVHILIQWNANVNAKDDTGKMALHNAAMYGHIEVVESLIANHAEVNANDNLGWTPLHFAASRGHLDAYKKLITLQADITARNKEAAIPLDLMHESLKHLEYVKLEQFKLNNAFTAKALYNYNSKTPHQISMKAGQLVRIKSHNQHGGWSTVSCLKTGRSGFCPSNYLELTTVITRSPPPPPPNEVITMTARVKHDFVASKTSQMSLEVDTDITVLFRGPPDGWSTGLDGDFPTNYVDFTPRPEVPKSSNYWCCTFISFMIF